MTMLTVAAIAVVALVIYLAWRGPEAQREPRPALFGSFEFEDRDIERVRQELVR